MNNLFKNASENKSSGKRAYESPEIKVLNVELEHSIAAGSAIVQPGNGVDNEIFEEWQVDPDDERIINW